MKKNIIRAIAFIGLLIAFFIGKESNNSSSLVSSSKLFKRQKIDSIYQSAGILKAYNKKQLIGYIARGKAQGYGGNLEIILLSDSLACIKDIEIIHNTETFSYITKLKNKKFLNQFKNKKIDDGFLIASDISAVSGATVSSAAISKASRNAAWRIAEIQIGKKPCSVKKKMTFGKAESIATIIFLLAFVAVYWKIKKLKYICFALSFVSIGFMFNASISLSHIGKLFLGYIPDIKHHYIWWLLMFGNLVFIILIRKNIYCSSICPFHATQILLNKLSGINIKMTARLSRVFINTPKVLLWVSLIIILISKNPTLASYEPFAMFFSLDGIGIQWYILPISLIGSIFISDFFCLYFCPVGVSFKLCLQASKQIHKKHNKWSLKK